MVNPLFLLALAAGGVYLYTKSQAAPAKPGEGGEVADPTGGWKPIVAKKPLSITELAPYAEPGVGVKFFVDHVHPSGNAIASPEALCNGEVVSVEMGSDGKRYWKVKLTNVSDNATYGAMPASLKLPAVGTVFALMDSNISG